ncbi:creatininase family protein [Ktedonosporobacter rubrisoli]|uniref:Creatininase family protein n=1 Tax=Ktedonosporobacter rubrisoli TaxID=2509675 RepID=A0A4P6JMQ4_KTERU|nr:creatininase family protein [Ktedonosporobacter rubrisoli]QBD76535.1 creatininase family protein [Ktedonosporobacter rubrisoli]
MRWEELSSDQFPAAVKQCEGVCLVALSVIERHGHHLPLGTDMYEGRELLKRAAALEPALIFPDHILTQIPEARHCPGTISIDGDLILRLLDNVCREIARNGLKKIVLVNAHGGNRNLLAFFNELQLYGPRDYVIYVTHPYTNTRGALEVPWEPASDGHAGPGETSMMLAIRPDLVARQQIPSDDESKAREHLQALKAVGVQTGIWWYADYPTHYAGDARPATAEIGEQLLDAAAQQLAQAIKAIKADTETRRLLDEFYAGSQQQ